jgi:hypothetical protein
LNDSGGDFSRPHGEKNSGGKNRIHEPGGIADAQQTVTGKFAVVIAEIGGRLYITEASCIFHAFFDGRTGLNPALENFLGLASGFGELILVNDEADAGFFGGERNDPEPFIFEADDDGIGVGFAGITHDIFKMPEDGEFFPRRMHFAQIFLVAGKVAASAGINQVGRAEMMNFSIGITCFDIHAGGVRIKLAGRPAFAHVRAGRTCMLEQNVIEGRAFNLNRFRFVIESTLPKNETRADGAVAQFELRAEFSRKVRRPQCRQHTHFLENGHVARQQRFTDVEARENFLFQHEYAFARPRQKCGGTAASGTATDYQRVISVLIHANRFDDVTDDGKLGNLRQPTSRWFSSSVRHTFIKLSRRRKKDCPLFVISRIQMWMHELDDNTLLREYVARDSGKAFAEIVTRHINKVYAVALRQCGLPVSVSALIGLYLSQFACASASNVRIVKKPPKFSVRGWWRCANRLRRLG